MQITPGIAVFDCSNKKTSKTLLRNRSGKMQCDGH